ncbi:hypothetical protein C8Q76DRAFT_609203, partial [Earliella scabrosa]
MWKGDAHPRVSQAVLHRPVREGGLGLLNLQARNEAIDLLWLKDYLDLSPLRPKWAYVADALLARAAPKSTRAKDPVTRVNAFLQRWQASTRRTAGLPNDLRRMVQAGKKYGVGLVTMKPSPNLKGAMPIWHHMGEGPGKNVADTVASHCLRERHGVATVGDCRTVAERTWRMDGRHRANPACGCFDCVTDRARWACDNPARCAAAASKAIKKLVPLWRPGTEVAGDGLSLTPRRTAANRAALAGGGRCTFDPIMTDELPIANAFRAFINDRVETDSPA